MVPVSSPLSIHIVIDPSSFTVTCTVSSVILALLESLMKVCFISSNIISFSSYVKSFNDTSPIDISVVT